MNEGVMCSFKLNWIELVATLAIANTGQPTNWGKRKGERMGGVWMNVRMSKQLIVYPVKYLQSINWIWVLSVYGGGSCCTNTCDVTAFKWLSICAELIWCFQIIVYWPKNIEELRYLFTLDIQYVCVGLECTRNALTHTQAYTHARPYKPISRTVRKFNNFEGLTKMYTQFFSLNTHANINIRKHS